MIMLHIAPTKLANGDVTSYAKSPLLCHYSSDEWAMIAEEEREEMGLTFSNDGEFWMCFDDFKTEFQRLEICYLGPDTLVEGDDITAKWEGKLMEGAWRRRVNAGGCANYKGGSHN